MAFHSSGYSQSLGDVLQPSPASSHPISNPLEDPLGFTWKYIHSLTTSYYFHCCHPGLDWGDVNYFASVLVHPSSPWAILHTVARVILSNSASENDFLPFNPLMAPNLTQGNCQRPKNGCKALMIMTSSPPMLFPQLRSNHRSLFLSLKRWRLTATFTWIVSSQVSWWLPYLLQAPAQVLSSVRPDLRTLICTISILGLPPLPVLFIQFHFSP